MPEDNDVWHAIDELRSNVNATKTAFAVHDAICGQRHLAILEKITANYNGLNETLRVNSLAARTQRNYMIYALLALFAVQTLGLDRAVALLLKHFGLG